MNSFYISNYSTNMTIRKFEVIFAKSNVIGNLLVEIIHRNHPLNSVIIILQLLIVFPYRMKHLKVRNESLQGEQALYVPRSSYSYYM